ncbi:MAG TPA: hypothetical protein VD931_08195, partial [Baekduia sp.]|nr:hypothetical protein [Baekduia sp.]
MHGRVVGALVAVMCAVGALAPAAVQAQQAPRDARCAGLVAGRTGLLAVGGEVRTPDQLAGRRGGFGPVTSSRVARQLPEDVVFRTPTESY